MSINLQQNARVSEGLLLKDVVTRAKIDRNTARYVLQTFRKLKLPAAEQGQHRRFNTDEAVRLALCARLIRLGLSREHAEETVDWCERRWRQAARRVEQDAAFLFDAHVANPWRICLVIDGSTTYVQIRPDRDARHRADKFRLAFEPDEFFHVPTWEKALLDDIRPDMIEARWSLTDMARELAMKRAE